MGQGNLADIDHDSEIRNNLGKSPTPQKVQVVNKKREHIYFRFNAITSDTYRSFVVPSECHIVEVRAICDSTNNLGSIWIDKGTALARLIPKQSGVYEGPWGTETPTGWRFVDSPSKRKAKVYLPFNEKELIVCEALPDSGETFSCDVEIEIEFKK